MLNQFILIGILTLLLSGCRTVHLARDVDYFALQSKVQAGDQVGLVKGYNCGMRVLGFGPGGKLTKAFDMLRDEQQLQYVTQMRVYRRYRSWLMVDRDCWIVRGIGYR